MPGKDEQTAWEKLRGKNKLTLVDGLKDKDSGQRQYITQIYSALYTELREKDARQQQAVTWGITLLSGSGLVLTFVSESGLTQEMERLIITLIVFATVVLAVIILTLAQDRMEIANVLNRIQQVMGVFDDGFYYQEGSLFPPKWLNWGSRGLKDINVLLAVAYVCVLIIIAIIDINILLLM